MLLYQAVHMCLLCLEKTCMLLYRIQLNEIIARELKYLCCETIRTCSTDSEASACVIVKCQS